MWKAPSVLCSSWTLSERSNFTEILIRLISPDLYLIMWVFGWTISDCNFSGGGLTPWIQPIIDGRSSSGQGVIGWPQTWSTVGFLWTSETRRVVWEFCAMSGKNFNQQNIFCSSFKYLCKILQMNRLMHFWHGQGVWWWPICWRLYGMNLDEGH